MRTKEELLSLLMVAHPEEENNPISLIIFANQQYRLGKPLITDQEYDSLLPAFGLKDGDPRLMDVNTHGVEEVLPYKMGSMEKIKTIKELTNWLTNKRSKEFIDNWEEIVLIAMPKLDGNSILDTGTDKVVYSRGDGNKGRPYGKEWIDTMGIKYLYPFKVNGELIISKEKFKHSDFTGYANPRNTVGGILGGTAPVTQLKHVDFIRYGVEPRIEALYGTKSKILDMLNKAQPVKIEYQLVKAKDVTVDMMQELYEKWGKEFEIDGLILEINDIGLRTKLGMETNSFNPAYGRAFKGIFDEITDTKVQKIVRLVNKDGELKPVLHITPVEIQGVTISKLFADNEWFLKSFGLGEGSNITIKRAGGVIPRVYAVEGIKVPLAEDLKKLRDKKVDIFKHLGLTINNHKLPTVREIFPDTKEIKVFEWRTDVEYGFAFPDGVKEVEIQRLIHFFECIDVKGVSDKILTDLYEKGFETISSILNLTVEQVSTWDGYGLSKATMICEELNSKVKSAPIEKIMHGSNCFDQLGSTKIGWAGDLNKRPIFVNEDVMAIKGFAEETSGQYIKGRILFDNWMQVQGMKKIVEEKRSEEAKPIMETSTSTGELSGKKFCFTKFRDKELEQIISDRGGLVTEDLTKSVTTLVVKDHGTASSKKDKAQKWGIQVIDHSELKTMLGKGESQSANAIF